MIDLHRIGLSCSCDPGLAHPRPGDSLVPRPGKWASTVATVLPDGMLDVEGTQFYSPSGAGKHVKGAVTNGRTFWRLADGRRLADVRAAYRGEKPAVERKGAFDWSLLHAILEALPEGNWTAYIDLAETVGTAAQPLGNHITTCSQCTNAHHVLTFDGRVAEAFAWSDPADQRDPAQLLRSEGVVFTDGRADSSRRLDSDELASLADPATTSS